MFAKSLGLTSIGLLVLALSVRGGTATVEGIVTDFTGRPIKGAEVWIEAKNVSKVVKTDASGHYTTDTRLLGSYKVTLVVNGSVKASIFNALTQLGKPIQLNFNVTTETASINKHIHMVWVPPDTGTLIGGGRWVDVDDKGNPVDDRGTNNVERISRRAGGPEISFRSSADCSCFRTGGIAVGLGAGRTVASFQAAR